MKKFKKILLIILSIIIIVAILTIAILKINLLKKDIIGNSIGNIREYGYVAEDNEYIYFMSPDENGTLKGIYRIGKNLEKEPELLIKGDWDITGINAYKGKIYFVTLSSGISEEDTVDNKIHSMKIDGSSHTVINDNEFHNNNYEIYVVKDKIYYIGKDQCIYSMNLDGSKKTRLNDQESGFVGINEKYIIYNVQKGNTEESNIVTYIMNLDGTEAREITGSRLYCVNIIDDEIYYLDMDRHIFKVKIGEKNATMISSTVAYNLNVSEDGIYYLRYIGDEQQAIYKMDFNGENVEKLKTLETESTFLGVLDEWLVYLDSNDSKGIIAMVSKDGKKYQELYSLEFEKYLENNSNTVTTNEIAEE